MDSTEREMTTSFSVVMNSSMGKLARRFESAATTWIQ